MTRRTLVCTMTALFFAVPISAQRHGLEPDSLEAIGVSLKGTRPDSALAHFRKALATRKASLDRRGEATALGHIGEIHADAGRLDSAAVAFRAALAIRRDLRDVEGESEVLTSIGDLYSKRAEFDSALTILRVALTLARQARAVEIEATALSNIGHAFGETGLLDSAMAYHRASLPLRRAVRDTIGEATSLNNIGSVHNERGARDSALYYFDAALVLARSSGDRELESVTFNNIGTLYALTGEPDSSLRYFQAALSIQHDLGARFQEVTTLGNIGYVHGSAGRADSALTYYFMSYRLAQAIGERVGEAVALTNIGTQYREFGRADSAITYLRLALPLHRLIADRQGEGVTLYNLGMSFIETVPDSALAYLRESLPMFREGGNRWSEATTLQAIGGAFANMRRLDSAAVNWAAALPIQREVGDVRGEAVTFNYLGRHYRETGQPDSALAAFRRALEIQRGIPDPAGEFLSLDNIAFLHHTAAPPWRDLRTATIYYDSAAAIFATLRRQAGSDANAVSLAEREYSVYDNWARAWAGRSRAADETPRQQALEAALAAAERGRAQATVELMTAGSAASAQDSEDIVARAGRDLPREATELLANLRAAHTSLLYYQHAADTLTVWHLTPDGALSLSQRRVTGDELAALIAALRAGLGAESARRAMVRGSSEQETTRRGLDLLGTADLDGPLAAISDLLVPAGLRTAETGRELVIVPHGILGLVPFSALRLGGDALPLGARYAVRYTPSLRALEAAEARPIPAASGSSLVVGNPRMPEVTTASGAKAVLEPLPGAQSEGEWLAHRLGAQLLTGGAATEATVRGRLPSSRIVHLATHGLAFGNDASVRKSYVALAPDAAHDGLLTLGEIMDDDALRLMADLVVLSACQTGLGDPKQAEGTVGLQRGLLAKGARTVLVSLWSVDDEATGFLMRRFYEHWLGGAGKAESLRRAQTDVRTSASHPNWRHSRYWAAFQLVGAR